MATIPIRERTQSDALPSLNSSAPVESEVGKAASGALKTADTILTAMAQERDIAMATEAYNDFSNQDRQMLSALTNLRGAEASKAADEYQNWYDKTTSKLTTKLENKNQQDLFVKDSSAARNRNLNTLVTHQATQHRAHMASAMDGKLSAISQETIMHPTDIYDTGVPGEEDYHQGAITRAFDAIDAGNPGKDNSASKAAVEAKISAISIQTLTQNGNTQKAREYLERQKDKGNIGGAAYESLLKDINAKDISDKPRANTTDIRSQAPGDLSKQLELVGQITDTDEMDATKKRVKDAFSDEKTAKEEGRRAFADGVAGDVYKMISQPGITKTQVEDAILPHIPSDDVQTQKEIRSLIRAEFKADQLSTDEGVFNAAVERIEGLAKEGKYITKVDILSEFGESLSKGDRTRLMTYAKQAESLIKNEWYKVAKSKLENAKMTRGLGSLRKPKEGKARGEVVFKDIHSELIQFVQLYPDRDPSEFIDKRIDSAATEEMYRKLGRPSFGEGYYRKKKNREMIQKLIISGDDDAMLTEVANFYGYSGDVAKLSPKQRAKYILTPDFQEKKSRMLEMIGEQ